MSAAALQTEEEKDAFEAGNVARGYVVMSVSPRSFPRARHLKSILINPKCVIFLLVNGGKTKRLCGTITASRYRRRQSPLATAVAPHPSEKKKKTLQSH